MINLSDYTDFFLFLSGLSVIGGITYLLVRWYFQSIFISDDELSKLNRINLKSVPPIQFLPTTLNRIDSQALLKRLSIILLIIIVAGFIYNQFLIWRMGSPWT